MEKRRLTVGRKTRETFAGARKFAMQRSTTT
jgi:hypothetical protein